MTRYNEEYGDPYGDNEPHWLSARDLLRLVALDLGLAAVAIGAGCAGWWLAGLLTA